MEEKIRKKEEEKEAKEARKKEREGKKLAREQEAKKKAAERQQKAEERQRRAEAKQEEARRKAKEKERKATEKRNALLEKEAAKARREEARLKRTTRSQQNKENLSETVPASASSEVITSHEDQQNECAVCMGKYEDDLIDGELQNEWICVAVGCTWTVLCLKTLFLCVFYVMLSSTETVSCNHFSFQ